MLTHPPFNCPQLYQQHTGSLAAFLCLSRCLSGCTAPTVPWQRPLASFAASRDLPQALTLLLNLLAVGCLPKEKAGKALQRTALPALLVRSHSIVAGVTGAVAGDVTCRTSAMGRSPIRRSSKYGSYGPLYGPVFTLVWIFSQQ